MNTNKPLGWQVYAYGAVIFIAGFTLYGISIHRRYLQEEEKHFQAEQTAKLITARELASKGFPAPESEIVGYKYYSCDVVITDAWANGTNHYVLLMEVKRDGKSWRALPESRRFFRVKKPIPDRKVYLAGWVDGILCFEDIDPVVPTKH